MLCPHRELSAHSRMKPKIKIPVKFDSETRGSIPSQKILEPHDNVRLNARRILCSFSKMLTEREKMALHWLAEGLTAGEIVGRFGNGTAVEIRHTVGGGIRSLPPTVFLGTANSVDTISAPRQSLGRLASDSANIPQQNENPS